MKEPSEWMKQLNKIEEAMYTEYEETDKAMEQEIIQMLEKRKYTVERARWLLEKISSSIRNHTPVHYERDLVEIFVERSATSDQGQTARQPPTEME